MRYMITKGESFNTFRLYLYHQQALFSICKQENKPLKISGSIYLVAIFLLKRSCVIDRLIDISFVRNVSWFLTINNILAHVLVHRSNSMIHTEHTTYALLKL